jgi:hypothetical protein
MPRDVVYPSMPPKASVFERLFDEHSDGRFVKTLLVIMLMIATAVQPFSLIYTAYGEHLPSHWWSWTPALAVFLFLALDWTILPLSYFFATTPKPGFKIMLGLMLAVVAFGAFEGYFTATERLVAMRLEEITKHRLAVERAEAQVQRLDDERNKKIVQQREDRDQLDKQRKVLTDQLAQIDKQIVDTQSGQAADKAQHPRTMAEIKDGCMKVPYVCLGPKQDAELKRHNEAQADFTRELAKLRADKTPINEKLAALDTKDDAKVSAANATVEAAEAKLSEVRGRFEEAVLGNQVYRWGAALFGKSPRNVSAEEANRVLDVFAAAVAISYVLTQVFLSIAFYGRHNAGLVQRTKISWSLTVRALRGYLLRKRRGVYRDRIKEVFIPTSERTRIVYVPVTPGGPVPPAEEFVSKAGSKVSHG